MMNISLDEANIMGTDAYSNLHKHIELRISPVHGKGLFAKSHIPKGTTVWMNRNDGPMEQNYKTYTFSELESIPDENRQYIVMYGSQLTEHTITGPESEHDVSLDNANYFNHSCSPNCLPINENIWIAIKDILPNDELTIDYITFDSNVYSNMPHCRCSSTNCRKSLRSDDYKLPDIQERYKGHFVSFIQDKIDKRQ